MDTGKNTVEDEKNYRKEVLKGEEKEVDSFDKNKESRDDQTLESDYRPTRHGSTDYDRRKNQTRP